jgi:hypothetical protein
MLTPEAMVIASQLHPVDEDLAPRRPASVEAIDARLSVWGQATRQAVVRRAEALSSGACVFAERHGREAALVASKPVDPVAVLLGASPGDLGDLAGSLLPSAVTSSCRILWVDPSRLSENLLSALGPHLEDARSEIRRVQALHRRRARLWRDDVDRLNQLREDVEGLVVPRGGPKVVEGVIDALEALREAHAARS